MAIGVSLDFDGIGIADYDDICKGLNFPAQWPDGLIAHGSAEDENGNLHVRDVWESAEHWERFRTGTLVPTIGAVMGERAVPPVETQRQLHTFYAQERVTA